MLGLGLGIYIPGLLTLVTMCAQEHEYGKAMSKFAVIGHHLYMVFRIGKSVNDVKTFKWLIREGKLEYQDNRKKLKGVPEHLRRYTINCRDGSR